MVLDSFRISLGRFLVDSEAYQKRHHDTVPSSARIGKRLPLLCQKDRAIWLSPDQSRRFQTRDVLGHCRGFYSEALGDFDGAGFSPGLDQSGDQFDIVLRHFAFMRLAHGCKSVGLRFRGSGVGREVFTQL